MAPECSAPWVLGEDVTMLPLSHPVDDDVPCSLRWKPYSEGLRHVRRQTWWCFIRLNDLQLKNVKINILLHCVSTNLSLFEFTPYTLTGHI